MRFSFLVYVSRSGSTLLARQLAIASRDLVVLPEFRLLEILLAEGDERIRALSPDELIQVIQLDHQLGSLGFSPQELGEIAAQAAGRGIRAVFEAVAALYVSKRQREANVAMIKLGSLLRIAAPLMHVFPEATFIHIFRDPRGVANSMLRNERPYFPGERMGRGDVVHIARHWKSSLRRAATFAEENPNLLLDVQYEEFCRRPSQTIERVLEFLGAVGRSEDGDPETDFAIVDRERSIHTLAYSDPQATRADAWKDELRPWQRTAIEYLASDEMLRRGYACTDSSDGERGRAAAWAYWVHLICSGRYYFRRLRYYSAHRRSLFNRLRLSKRQRAHA